MKSVLIGIHPKGFSEPFDDKTHSGRVIRKAIRGREREFVLLDLWQDELEQKSGQINKKILAELQTHLRAGNQLIALGREVERALTRYGLVHRYLPHPAARAAKARALLAEQLAKL